MTGLRIQVASCLTLISNFTSFLCFPFLIGCMFTCSLEVNRGKSRRITAKKSAEYMRHEAASFVKPKNPHFVALIGRSSQYSLVSSYVMYPTVCPFVSLAFCFQCYEHNLIVIIIVLIMPLLKMIILLIIR